MKKLFLILAASLTFCYPAHGMERIKSWLGLNKKQETVKKNYINPLRGDCPICHEPLKMPQPPVAITILPCNDKHIFHHPCIGKWLKDHHSCPLCRAHANLSLEEPHQLPTGQDSEITNSRKYQILSAKIINRGFFVTLSFFTFESIDFISNKTKINPWVTSAFLAPITFYIYKKYDYFFTDITVDPELKFNIRNCILSNVSLLISLATAHACERISTSRDPDTIKALALLSVGLPGFIGAPAVLGHFLERENR